MNLSDLVKFLASICAVVFVFSPHEYAHAFVAYKNGDPTAKLNGRLTLNPLKHLDPAGFIACALVGFGWAKPVPVDPRNFRNYKVGLFTTAIAGVVVNYIIAFIAYLCYTLFLRFVVSEYTSVIYSSDALLCLCKFCEQFFGLIYAYSLCSVVFNLLPLYPLDGFRVVEAFTRQINPVQRFLREYGQAILLILIAESFICNIASRYVGWIGYLNVLDYIMSFATRIIGYPINVAWGWIFAL